MVGVVETVQVELDALAKVPCLSTSFTLKVGKGVPDPSDGCVSQFQYFATPTPTLKELESFA